MRTLFRLAILGGAAALALALSAPALAAFTPRLDVSVPNGLGASGQVKVHLAVGPTDDTTARLAAYSPVGFTASPGSPGATIGRAAVRVLAADLGGAIVPVAGTIEVRAATGTASVGGVPVPLTQLALLCTGTATHTAFWIIKLTVAGNVIEFPAYFDLTTGAEQTLGSSKVTFCGQPNDVPQGTPGRAPFGIKLVDTTLTFNRGVFTNPGTAGAYLWTSIWTPFNPGVGTPNVPGTVSSVSLTPLPVSLTLRALFSKPKKSAALAGRISLAGAFTPGVRLPIFSGATRTGLRRSGSTNGTKANGAFTAVKKMVRTTYYQVRFAIPAFDAPEICATVSPNLGLPRCVTSTVGAFSVRSSIVKVNFRR